MGRLRLVLKMLGFFGFGLFLGYAIWLAATPTPDGGHQTFGTLYLVGLGVMAMTVGLVSARRRSRATTSTLLNPARSAQPLCASERQ